jgi:cytochrome P450
MGLDGIVTIKQMMGWATAVVTAFGTSYANPRAAEGAEKAIVEITEIVGAAIGERRRDPREDLLTQLVQLSEDGDKLTTDEIIYLFHVVLLGGFDTTGHTLAHIVNTLRDQPGHVGYIRAHPDRDQIVVDELQRHIGLIGAMSRVVGEDMEWGGRQACAGDLVYLMFAAANRDPEAFAEPDELRFDRPRVNSMVFGPGLHHCVGHYFARMQLEVGVDVLYRGGHHVEVRDESLVWTPNPLTRSLLRLPVTVTPAGAS